MHLQQIHPKVLVYLLEFSGNAGVMCQTSEMFECPHFNTAMYLFLKLPTNELNRLLQTVVHPSGAVTNWHRYLNYNKRAYKSEYLRSGEWKRKRDAVMHRAMMKGAMQPRIPENPVIKRSVDKYGRVIKSIEVELKPICEAEGCENEAKQVHHKHYDNIGKEQLEDLQALCKKCHAERSPSGSQRKGSYERRKPNHL